MGGVVLLPFSFEASQRIRNVIGADLDGDDEAAVRPDLDDEWRDFLPERLELEIPDDADDLPFLLLPLEPRVQRIPQSEQGSAERGSAGEIPRKSLPSKT